MFPLFTDVLGVPGFTGQLLDGALVTLAVSLTSLAVGVVFGVVLALMKLSSYRLLRIPAETYTLIIRGLPELLVILFVFFAIPIMVNESVLIPLGMDPLVFNPFIAGVIALSSDFGSYSSEVFRSAFLSFPKGQVEAAKAVGMPKRKVFFRIVLPQIWAPTLPPLGNLWMNLLKGSALVSAITLDEVMRQADIARQVTKDPFTWYGAAALVFLFFTFLSEMGQRRLEKWAGRGLRRA